ncbi:TolC family protein [Longimicrobium sp.]|uniref:TolC family protein n=1 Tax=Longimicrobium sp. TaxID=2029185 RepID=UPI002E32708A|nr:TolC family protein [Longimicrobium sp.]HEX6036815.1 TolC family protein [Longimicrobium sp.]
MNRLGWTLAVALAAGTPAALAAQVPAAGPVAARGDSVSLSLDEAVARALGQSEEIRLARSQVELAETQVREARAGVFPQVNAQLGYTRTFASQFQGGGGFTLPDSLRFEPDSNASLEERVRYLEQNAPLAGLGGLGSLFGNLPFGQENAYQATLTGSQLLYSGGRTGAALRIARDYREVARLTLTEQSADIELQVREAYVRALLAQELASSAQQALEQAEAFLAQERLRLGAGRASELEVLRAEVSRDNLRPQLVQAQNAAQLASLDLKRLVDITLGAPLRLTTPLDVPTAQALAQPAIEAEAVSRRASVAAAERQVSIAEQNIRIARGAFLPSVSLNMNYGRVLFPSSPFDLSGDWRTDWTGGLTVQVPLFSGGQRAAQLQRARVQAEQARLQLSQLREGVQLQYEQAAGERERARTAIAARQTTVQAAQRVYDLTVLRYQQGLATQLEVSQARLELLQARTNLAQAVSDFLIADAGVVRAVGGTPTGAGISAEGVGPLDTTPSIPNPSTIPATSSTTAPVPNTTTTTP